jgi:hypothetical protein
MLIIKKIWHIEPLGLMGNHAALIQKVSCSKCSEILQCISEHYSS